MAYVDILKTVNDAEQALANRKQAELDEKTSAELPNLMASSGLAHKGPPQDSYNYKAFHQEGGDFTPDENNGVTLQNKYAKGMTVAGVDINTGKKVGPQFYGGSMDASIEAGWPKDWDEPSDGGTLVDRGRKKLAESSYNTATGHPEEDVHALTDVYRGAFKEGADFSSVDIPGWPDTQKQPAAMAAVALELTEKDIATIVNGEFDYAVAAQDQYEIDPLPEGETSLDKETIKSSAGWQADSTVIAEYMGRNVTTPMMGEDSDRVMYEMAQTFNSPIHMAALLSEVKSGIMPKEVAAAYVRQWQRYDQMENMSFEVIAGALLATVNDPINMGGVAALAQMAFRKPMQKAIMQKIFDTAMGKAAAVGTSGAVGGAAAIGEYSTLEQQLRVGAGQIESADWDKVINDAKFGAVAGLSLGMGTSLAVSAVRAGIKNWGKKAPSSTTPMTRQRGSVGWFKDDSINAIDINAQYGIPLEDSTYSRLEKAVVENLGIDGSDASLNKSINLEGLKGSVGSRTWMAGGKQNAEVAGYSSAELGESGLQDWLQAQIDAGNTKLPAYKILDYMWANKDRVRKETSVGPRGSGKPGERTYPGVFSKDTPTNVSSVDNAGNFYDALGNEVPKEQLTPEFQKKFMADKLALQLARRSFKIQPVEAKPDNVQPLVEYGRAMDSWFEKKALNAEEVSRGVDKSMQTIVPPAPRPPAMANSDPSYIEWVTKRDKYARAKFLQNKEIDNPGDPTPVSRKEFNIVGVDDKVVNEKPYATLEAANGARFNSIVGFTDNLTFEQMVQLRGQLDNNLLTEPVVYKHLSFAGDAVPHPDEYTEIRLFTQNNDAIQLDDIAVGRFGTDLESLPKSKRERVFDIKKMMAEDTDGFYEPYHYASEVGRFTHIRANAYYDKDGVKTFFIEEMQTDRRKEYFQGAKPEGGGATKPQKKFSKNWDEVAFREAIREAKKRGYARIAWPSDADQVAQIERWPEPKTAEEKAEDYARKKPIFEVYGKRMPKLAKSMNLKVNKEKMYTGVDGDGELGEVFIIDLSDYNTSGKPTPLNGFAVTPAGALPLYGEEKDGEK